MASQRVSLDEFVATRSNLGNTHFMEPGFSLDISCYRLSPAIEPYFTALHTFDIDCGSDGLVEDYLHPEWAAMRFSQPGLGAASAIFPDKLEVRGPITVSGPTSRAMRFTLPTIRFVSLGLRPAGWARFVPASASGFANKIVDGAHHAFSAFAPLLDEVRTAADDGEVAARFDRFLTNLHETAPPAPERVMACQDALRDTGVREVDDLCERVGTSRRTLERLCSRFFGFPPKTLIRRQRFLRSLGEFMRESHRRWSTALDGDYYDQAHFVRDFRSFMGITPSEYAGMPHPIVDQIIAQRMVDQGAAPWLDASTSAAKPTGSTPQAAAGDLAGKHRSASA